MPAARAFPLVVLALCLAACDQEPPPGYGQQVVLNQEQAQRFTVELAGQFPDDLAYKGVRRIYVIRDSHTERTLVGITGVGVTEVGTHTEGGGGKHNSLRTVEDER